MPNQTWTDAETKIVVDHPNDSDLGLSRRLTQAGHTRSLRAVRDFRTSLGLREPAQSGWTEDRVALLQKDWLNGMSASQIGKKLGGISRSAVIGKAHRLGIIRPAQAAGRMASGGLATKRMAPRPVSPKKPNTGGLAAVNAIRKVERLARDAERFEPSAVNIAGPAAASRNITMADPRFGGCRWPTSGEGAETRFCCIPTDGETYCSAHARRAYQGAAATVRKSTNELIRGLRRYA